MVFPLIIPVVVGAVKCVKWLYDRNQEIKPSPPSLYPVQNQVTLIGTTSAGKSSLANELVTKRVFKVGPEHGTTTQTEESDFGWGHRICDTPGLLDTNSPPVLSLVRTARVIIYVTAGQVFQPELEALGRIKQYVIEQEARGTGKRYLLVFCNKQDTRTGCMPPADVATIEMSLRTQVADFALEPNIFFGSTRPEYAHSVESLRSKIAATIIPHT